LIANGNNWSLAPMGKRSFSAPHRLRRDYQQQCSGWPARMRLPSRLWRRQPPCSAVRALKNLAIGVAFNRGLAVIFSIDRVVPREPALSMGSVTVANGVLYVPSMSGFMYALDAATLWAYQAPGSVNGEAAVGTVYWGTGYHNFPASFAVATREQHILRLRRANIQRETTETLQVTNSSSPESCTAARF
jgi:hypothetical protein